MSAAIPLLTTHEPTFYRAFLAYPKQQILGVKTDFFWVKKWADDRPVFTSAHRMIKAEPDRMLVVRREFYVGHSFNAEQWVARFFSLTLPAAINCRVSALSYSRQLGEI